MEQKQCRKSVGCGGNWRCGQRLRLASRGLLACLSGSAIHPNQRKGINEVHGMPSQLREDKCHRQKYTSKFYMFHYVHVDTGSPENDIMFRLDLRRKILPAPWMSSASGATRPTQTDISVRKMHPVWKNCDMARQVPIIGDTVGGDLSRRRRRMDKGLAG